ncbi:hypothetical protein [Rhizomonospora bruguierae]|uniref:hypothetical protein n=1 Tax=Rhizomonospora bruguierae TaxID=1581705 RepID=UPI001BCCBCE7|nr:hypothetical protein [Micromonospora sp. NBRC 107566]
MTRSITVGWRVALLAGVAAAGLGLTACSAGQYAETARKRPSVTGNQIEIPLRTTQGAVGGLFYVRNLQVAYNGTEGYPSGGSAPVEVHLVNESAVPLTVRVSLSTANGGPSADPQLVGAADVRLAGGHSGQVEPQQTLGGTISPSPATGQLATPAAGSTNATADAGASAAATEPTASASAGPTPTAPADQPAEVQVPPRSVVVFDAQSAQLLQVQGLSGKLAPGGGVRLRFEVAGAGLAQVGQDLIAPVGLPLSPAPRATPVAPGPHEQGGVSE